MLHVRPNIAKHMLLKHSNYNIVAIFFEDTAVLCDIAREWDLDCYTIDNFLVTAHNVVVHGVALRDRK